MLEWKIWCCVLTFWKGGGNCFCKPVRSSYRDVLASDSFGSVFEKTTSPVYHPNMVWTPLVIYFLPQMLSPFFQSPLPNLSPLSSAPVIYYNSGAHSHVIHKSYDAHKMVNFTVSTCLETLWVLCDRLDRLYNDSTKKTLFSDTFINNVTGLWVQLLDLFSMSMFCIFVVPKKRNDSNETKYQVAQLSRYKIL